MSSPFPWQQTQWRAIQQRIDSGRLPHAMLLSGPDGLGKFEFARQLAHTLLCEQPDDGKPCGACRGCLLLAAGSHPDFRLVQPEEEGKEITVGQIRDLLAWQALTPQYSRARVVIIEPADRMNMNAANALLKTLEEPGRDAVLLLVSARPAALLPTIRSRCQQTAFDAQTGPETLAWLAARLGGNTAQAGLVLAVAGGAPLRAQALMENGGMERRETMFHDFSAVALNAEDPVAVAARWLQWPVREILITLHSWVVDMSRLKVAADIPLGNPDLREHLQVLCEQVDLRDLLHRQTQLQETLRQAQGHSNVQLLLEDLLLGWSGGSEPAARRAATTR